MTTVILAFALTKGKRAIDARVAQRVADMLASPDPEMVRKAASMAAKNPRLMEAIDGASDYLTKVISPAANENVSQPLAISVRPYVSPFSSAASEQDERR